MRNPDREFERDIKNLEENENYRAALAQASGQCACSDLVETNLESPKEPNLIIDPLLQVSRKRQLPPTPQS